MIVRIRPTRWEASYNKKLFRFVLQTRTVCVRFESQTWPRSLEPIFPFFFWNVQRFIDRFAVGFKGVSRNFLLIAIRWLLGTDPPRLTREVPDYNVCYWKKWKLKLLVCASDILNLTQRRLINTEDSRKRQLALLVYADWYLNLASRQSTCTYFWEG